MTKSTIASIVGVAVPLALLAAFPAHAQELSASTSCLRGSVPAGDYAELGQNIQESMWDRRGGVTLASDIGGVRLRVQDMGGTNVCQEEANTSTYCTFRLDISVTDQFSIFVDNADNEEPSNYRLCAY